MQSQLPLTRNQCRISDTQVTVKACGPLVFSNEHFKRHIHLFQCGYYNSDLMKIFWQVLSLAYNIEIFNDNLPPKRKTSISLLETMSAVLFQGENAPPKMLGVKSRVGQVIWNMNVFYFDQTVFLCQVIWNMNVFYFDRTVFLWLQRGY